MILNVKYVVFSDKTIAWYHPADLVGCVCVLVANRSITGGSPFGNPQFPAHSFSLLYTRNFLTSQSKLQITVLFYNFSPGVDHVHMSIWSCMINLLRYFFSLRNDSDY